MTTQKTSYSFHTTLLASAVALASLSTQAAAENSTELDTLVVTATTTPQRAKDSVTSVTIIDQEAIERQQPQALTDILAGQPGVDFVTNGGYGKTTSVYTRGSSSTGTKLLIDGVPIQSHSTGSPNWQYVPMTQVERVEIVRGPKSSLYGSSAAGGVIQVFLPEAQQETRANIDLMGGSFATKQADVSVAGGTEQTQYVLAVGGFATDGTAVKEDSQEMGYDNTHMMARVRHEFDNDAYLKALIMNAQGESDYQNFSGDLQTNEFVNQILALTAGVDINEAWQSELQVRESRDEDETVDAQGQPTGSYFDSRTRAVRWNNTLWLDNHELVAGTEYSEDSFDGSFTKERDNTSVFAQSISDFGPTRVQLNIRADHYSEYDTQTTGGVAFGYQLNDTYRLRLSGRTSFTAPTFNSMNAESYGYSELGEIQPETSKTLEVGLRADYEHSFWDVALYQADYDDLIAWDFASKTIGNVDQARVQGLEFETGVRLSQWQLGAAATVLDTENRSAGAQQGNRLARRAHQSARLELDRHFEKGLLGATLIGYGERYDDAANTTMLSGYGLLNLRAQYDLAPHWNAKLTVKNALDKSYQQAEGYLNPGRGVFLSVHYDAF